jgi:hypothetical protein
MQELSLVLWRGRELLDMLLFKLEEQQLVLASGRTRWLPYAAREVETVLDSLQQTELLRATTADAAAAAMGLGGSPSLRALAEASAEPWRSILFDHREALAAVAAQITEMATSNRELITAAHQDTRSDVLVEIASRGALATTARALQPSLVDFMR